MAQYPLTGFHFLVSFDSLPALPVDSRFQDVSGLDVEMEMESFTEGGQNRFTWQLPKRTRYADIVLKRGKISDSAIVKWCRDAMEHFIFFPLNITISLLNEKHEPVQSWYVVNAIPKKWSLSNFNAEENSIVIESITLNCQYFTMLTT
ncbi:MAG TPA: phage tail protein [Chitinophagaceae bacterium]|nr:phage tail protein [Chitinophagaceae bacterium]